MTLTHNENNKNNLTKGIVLFAHGSRDPLWSRPLQAVAQKIRDDAANALVDCAYLELCSPSLLESVTTMVSAGIKSITVVPMFLGMGKHAREDLPLLVAELTTTYPNTEFLLQPAVGEDERLIQTLCDIALQK
ncbi:sirohydrochlorin chelatase [Rhodoferax aquaticus]|uniref:Cobalamin biosynthesis protein CbiX n=1 Tax=Rhodoferax aquaticus TaxID=2527691 RepID=A0A515ENY2_9BURK|nr:CbiX/SirB N-terminal domain-containing protein [Rhodoferax aquaticus]QDL54373.1 cobalamin biosynthesis protein CbiX [Rhodoferax aquaticus]